MLGDLTPKDAGKNVLNAIKHLAQTEPIDAANQNHSFGNDFYLMVLDGKLLVTVLDGKHHISALHGEHHVKVFRS